MQFVRRSEWGAPSTSAAQYIGSTKGVKVHYLGSPYTSRDHSKCDDQVRAIRAAHLRSPEGYSDIAYNMLVCEHGYVYEGRGALKKTGANGSSMLNSRHYAVCALLGSSGLTKPTDAMLHGLRDAIEYLRTHGAAGSEILGHRDGYATACPGQPLYDWVKKGAPRPGVGSKPAPSTGGTYTVKAGDTLSAIAARLKTTVAKLTSLNKLKDPDKLSVGQILKLPGRAAPKPQEKPVVDLSKLVAAAKSDPPKRGTPVSYSGTNTVEQALVKEKLLDKDLADGHFGTATKTAYARWQRRCGYSGSAADGVPGRASLERLGRKHSFSVA
jgi:peptidoglycan hydrolase-like protein with peptidoglycan-binding domain